MYFVLYGVLRSTEYRTGDGMDGCDPLGVGENRSLRDLGSTYGVLRRYS